MAIRACLTEFIGTFFLVFTIGMVIRGGTTDEPLLLAPLAIGGVLMVMVYMGGHISGGHYNPAVSLAAMLRGKLSGIELALYWAAQILGAIVAALMVYGILSKTFAPAPAPAVGIARALLVEFIFTFALALVVLNTATAPRTEGNSYFGLAIGFTIVVGAIAGGGISGGAYNPAVAIGPTLVDTLLGSGTLRDLWIYLVAPLAGGAAAAAVFRFQNRPDLA
ncbi:MIP/aquaporin family protein [Fontivita pretiosa]|uniref:MIP/aquaporin family protein n=1 Tax=Fontivita pretiosa TaxID=2989684 RepID=UPI003D17A01A